MKNYNLKNDKADKYKVQGMGELVKWNDDFLKGKEWIFSIQKNTFEHDIDSDGNVLFKIKYDSLVPKTSRINFKKKWKNKNEIAQKDIRFKFNSKGKIVESYLFYCIKKEDFQLFQNNLTEIVNNQEYYFNRNSYTDKDLSGKNKENKEIIKAFSFVKGIYKIDEINELKEERMVKVFHTCDDLNEKLKKIGVISKLDTNTNHLLLNSVEFDLIKKNMPWILSRKIESRELGNETKNFDSFEIPDFKINDENIKSQIIGVIDSSLSLEGEFSKLIDKQERLIEENGTPNFKHGNLVSSIIMANDEINSVKDGLGNFRIRHFELTSVKKGKSYATVKMDYLMDKLENIVKNNLDIKVWNVSIGELKKQTNSKLMSTDGIFLDVISDKYKCLFVVSSGNERKAHGLDSLCAPADSLNCISVGSVSLNEKGKIKPSDFSSIGNVLLCRKPEVSHFGGPFLKNGEHLRAIGEFDIPCKVKGTSFAAPMISRLAASLISEGYSVLEAKAAIIGMANRETPTSISSLFGYVDNEKTPVLSLKTTYTFSKKEVVYFDIELDNVDEVSVSWCNMVNSLPSLGEEYSITNFEVDIIKYDLNWEQKSDKNGRVFYTPEQTKTKLKTKLTSAWKTKMEHEQRYERGKFFTSHREDYIIKDNPNSISIDNKNDFKYAIRIKRLDLFNVENIDPIELGINIAFFGEKLNAEDFIQKNSTIIDIETVYESEIENK